MRDNKKENLFIDLEDEENLYWLGFIATDGCILVNKEKHNYQVAVGLAAVDRDHLVKLKEFSGAKSNIYDYINQGKYPGCSFSICSKTVANRLIRLGLTPKKSKTLCVSPRLSSSHHFWRGAIDGDGSISFTPDKAHRRKTKTYYSDYLEVRIVSASKKFLEQFVEYLANTLDIHKNILQDKRRPETVSTIYRVRITKKADCLKILKLFYVDNKVALTRKEQLAHKILHHYDVI